MLRLVVFADLDMPHVGRRRAFAAPCDKRIERGSFAFGFKAHRAIRLVPYETDKAERPRLLPRAVPETDILHGARDTDGDGFSHLLGPTRFLYPSASRATVE